LPAFLFVLRRNYVTINGEPGKRGHQEPSVARNQPKTIVVTGATRGLGLAMVEKFIELGHTVLGCGRSREQVEMLRHKYQGAHDFAVVDVARESQVEPWAARILSSRGTPDLLINNAAVINKNAPLWQVPAEEFDAVIDVNVKGVANVIRHLVPAMVAHKAGVIVNISSGWGRSVAKEVAPYCASKWAIEGLTLALAEELPRGMAAIPLNPGVIDTDMLRSCFGGTASRYPSAKTWIEKAAPFILALNSRDNGKSLTAPG
jgi:NAD(P)-dependent dehydrogenase (short-subunit alcohol dehydrogenase family)